MMALVTDCPWGGPPSSVAPHPYLQSMLARFLIGQDHDIVEPFAGGMCCCTRGRRRSASAANHRSPSRLRDHAAEQTTLLVGTPHGGSGARDLPVPPHGTARVRVTRRMPRRGS